MIKSFFSISYCKLLSSNGSCEDNNLIIAVLLTSEDTVDQPIRLQQPKLPDLETHLHVHVQHAKLIADVEKGLLMMQNFPVAAVTVSGLLVRKEVKIHLNSLIQSVSSDIIIIDKTKNTRIAE